MSDAAVGKQADWQHNQPCLDYVDRERNLRCFLTDEHRIGLQVPAGEVAILDIANARKLRATIDRAITEATRRGGGRHGPDVVVERSVEVTDSRGNAQHLAVTAHGGQVTYNGLEWWRESPRCADALADALRDIAALARLQPPRGH